MVVTEIFKWIKTVQRDSELFFYRTRSGMEIDLLLKTEAGIIGIEIKGRESISVSACRALKAIADALGKEWLGGLVVYRGNKIMQLAEPEIWAVPSKRLFT
jgi:predicted AAA+ superfamily ATPase